MDIKKLSALETARLIHRREITVREVIEALNVKDEFNAFISRDFDAALKSADLIQARIDRGKIRSPLAGVPIAVKDNICTRGIRTTCASKMLSDFIAPYNATVIEKIQAADMPVLGKTNMDEFAMGCDTSTSFFNAVKNPLSPSKTAGGSSGGSAAAVIGGSALIALGTDTGGSVRQPCSFCGAAGLKPTYGAVSRRGLIAYASSLDTIGTVSKDIEDSAALFNIIRGRDKGDSTSLDSREVTLKSGGLKGKKIGIAREFFNTETDERVYASTERFREAGAEIVSIDMPLLKYAVSAYYIIACAEASSNLARYDGVRYGLRAKGESIEEMFINSRSEGFGAEVKKRIMLGNYVLSSGFYDEYYLRAQKIRNALCSAFDCAFEKCDFILAPVCPHTAPRYAESGGISMYLDDIYTVPVNLAGLPALTLPCEADGDGMPVGLQLIGRAFDENGILNAALAFQKVTGGKYGI